MGADIASRNLWSLQLSQSGWSFHWVDCMVCVFFFFQVFKASIKLDCQSKILLQNWWEKNGSYLTICFLSCMPGTHFLSNNLSFGLATHSNSFLYPTLLKSFTKLNLVISKLTHLIQQKIFYKSTEIMIQNSTNIHLTSGLGTSDQVCNCILIETKNKKLVWLSLF